MEIFEEAGLNFLSRWGHFLSGITWIGLLYYFNFVQVPSFAAFEAPARTEAIRKLASRALWWFRWGAVLTLATGLLMLMIPEGEGADSRLFDMDYYKTASGMSIATGALMAIIMFANVWLVIWPNQKVVIASAEGVAAGREALPNAAAAGRKALTASRTNTMLSIPMLFYMGATSHFAPLFDVEEGGKRAVYWIVTLVLLALIELNALGRLGGYGPGPNTQYLDTHQNTIIAGFVLAVLYIVFWEILF